MALLWCIQVVHWCTTCIHSYVVNTDSIKLRNFIIVSLTARGMFFCRAAMLRWIDLGGYCILSFFRPLWQTDTINSPVAIVLACQADHRDRACRHSLRSCSFWPSIQRRYYILTWCFPGVCCDVAFHKFSHSLAAFWHSKPCFSVAEICLHHLCLLQHLSQ